MFRLLTLFCSLLLAACQSTTGPTGATPLPPNTLPGPRESPNIFESYTPEGDAKPAKGWASSFDLSGVSFDARETVTLVTRRHVVMANHFQRKPGTRVVFHDRRGRRLERRILSTRRVMGDVAVGLLDQEVPASYKVYPLPKPGTDPQKLIGRLAAVTDQNRRIFFHRINFVNNTRLGFRYDEPTRVGWSKKLVAGDSGNPSFLPSNGDLILIETHTSGGPGSGPYYGSPELQEKLQATIDDLMAGYRLSFRSL